MDRIQSPEEEFQILHAEKDREEFEVLYCTADSDGRDYTLVHFLDFVYVRRVLPYFYEWMERGCSGDYRGCFVRQGELYTVFLQKKGRSLSSLLEEGCLSLKQRCLTGKKILEQIILYQMPDFFICQMLLPERICLQGEHPIFTYGWDMEIEPECGKNRVCLTVANLMHDLFKEEVERDASQSLTELIKWLKREDEKDILAIYQAYRRMTECIADEVKSWRSPVQKRREKLSLFLDRSLQIGRVTKKSYIRLGTVYIRKRLVFIVLFGSVLIFFGLFMLLLPYLRNEWISRWGTRVMFVNAPERFNYTGRVKLTGDREGNQILFVGSLQKGSIEGEGTLYDYDGNLLYQGSFEKEVYHGRGTEYYPNHGKKYQGDFVHGQYEGTGKCYDSDGTLRYEGELAKGIYEGNGKLYDKEGRLCYDGAFVGGKYEGSGKLYDKKERLQYEGDFAVGVYEGNGKLYDSIGRLRYEGNFAKGKYEGQGKLYDRKGRLRYEGDFAVGEYEGNGKLYDRKERLCYDGEFVEGHYQGQGRLYFPETGNVIYEGSFFGGLCEGEGKSYDGLTGIRIYEGEFHQGQYDGNGILYAANEAVKYKGEFRRGKYHGYGILYRPSNGEIKKQGQFRNGTYVKPEKTDKQDGKIDEKEDRKSEQAEEDVSKKKEQNSKQEEAA